MSLKIYINGKLYDKEDAKISVYDHGLLYGDGVFEGIRSYGGKVFRLERAPRPAVGLGQGHLAGNPHRARRNGQGVERHARSQRHQGRLHPPGGHARRRQLGLDPNRTSDPQVIIIADHISLYPRELYEKGLEIVTASTHAQPSGGAQPADQVAQLSEQHPGQDRGPAGRLHRSPDAQPQGRSRRVHRRQHLPRAQAACCSRRRSTPAFWKASPATPSSSWPREPGIDSPRDRR